MTVPERGWQGIRNGELLKLAGQEFAVFLTADQNLEFQQNLAEVPIAIVVLMASSNRLEAYVPMERRIRAAIQGAGRGTVTKVAA